MILTITMSPAVDLFATTDQFHHDSKTRCQIQSRHPGGGGINVARNLQRCGLPVRALFPAGGHHGDLLRSMLEADGLPIHCVPANDETTQNIALSESSSGNALHLVFPGAQLTETEWEACLTAVRQMTPAPSMLVISGSLPPPVPEDFFARIIQHCRAVGIPVVLDTSGPPLQKALAEGVYFVKMNREDFAALGYQGDEAADARISYLSQLARNGMADCMVLTLGPNGALLATRDGLTLHASPPPVKVISHAGAGDAFVSIMTSKLYQGRDVQEAFCYGVAAAAAAISTPGNQLEDMDWLEEVYRGLTVRRLSR